ncbi:DNA cytosine methyltransferase [Virgibacillus dokdonensis]|uniref:DNA cytosine methyltransferase n=1 Tax=Virgibacillus dokdonensis TaxID=302167 RepID=UPI0020C952EB|nr:DNA cytosine methyltransferase [Virgibacillus dokdonensis]
MAVKESSLNTIMGSSMTPKRKIYAIDLFSGAGGLTHGLERVGVEVRLGIDIDPACEFPYTQNNKAEFLLKSVEDLKGSEIASYYRKNSIKLLAGCAPCQTFSTYNQKATQDDKRWWLLKEFSRIVREVNPELITMENVSNLEGQNVFEEFLDELKSLNYHVSFGIVNCAVYGVPQHRNRLVLLASKFAPINLLPPEVFSNGVKTVRDAIYELPPIKAGEIYKDDPLHQSSELNELNLRRIKSSRPGGTWRDWDEDLIADCHKKDSGKTYPSVYGRMSWESPAPTMTTQFFGFGNGRFGHPEQDRAISLREGAIFQSFPSDYEFVPKGEPVIRKSIGRLIGNAVPVKLGEVIGLSFHKHVRDNIRTIQHYFRGEKING